MALPSNGEQKAQPDSEMEQSEIELGMALPSNGKQKAQPDSEMKRSEIELGMALPSNGGAKGAARQRDEAKQNRAGHGFALAQIQKNKGKNTRKNKT